MNVTENGVPRSVALMGIGKIARDQHIPSIANSPDWVLAATVSSRSGVDGVENYKDIESLLAARPDIEVISLCMPPQPRFTSALKAIAAGRHVMLEKPPGATTAECLALEAAAREKGVSLFATWHSREAATVEIAADWLRGKQLKRLTITWREDVRRWHPGQAWIWQAGGLGVFDPGINALSIMTRILAEAVHVAKADLYFPENCETPIAADLTFAHPGGADVTANFDFRQTGHQTWNIEAETTDGTLLLSEGGGELSLGGAPMQRGRASSLNDEYPRLYARMAELIRSKGIDMDIRPLVHVADAFLLGRRIAVEPFVE
jgi:D-galactose 1-dehydrogenase